MLTDFINDRDQRDRYPRPSLSRGATPIPPAGLPSTGFYPRLSLSRESTLRRPGDHGGEQASIGASIRAPLEREGRRAGSWHSSVHWMLLSAPLSNGDRQTIVTSRGPGSRIRSNSGGISFRHLSRPVEDVASAAAAGMSVVATGMLGVEEMREGADPLNDGTGAFACRKWLHGWLRSATHSAGHAAPRRRGQPTRRASCSFSDPSTSSLPCSSP